MELVEKLQQLKKYKQQPQIQEDLMTPLAAMTMKVFCSIKTSEKVASLKSNVMKAVYISQR